MTIRLEGHKLVATYRVRGYHIDVNGHVNNAQYLHFLEDARDDSLRFLGVSAPDLEARGIHLFLSEVHLRFERPAVYGDELEVWGWLSMLGRAIAVWTMEIRRAGAGDLLTRCTLRVACVDGQGHVIPIPADLHAQLETIYAPEKK
jgi:thioesterase-3